MTLEPTPMNTKQSGFTLVELIAVIVILGILAAVIVPKYLDVTAEAADAASRAALSEGISRVTQSFSRFIITTTHAPTAADWATLSSPTYLDLNGAGQANIGDYLILYTVGPPITLTLQDTSGNIITWRNDPDGAGPLVALSNVSTTIGYPQ